MRRRAAPSLAQIQESMQAAILSGDVRSVLPAIRAGAHADRDTLIGVYTFAYAQRLVGILKADFPLTALYMGDEAFDAAARSYIAAHPSPHRSARWVGDRFATHLASQSTVAAHRQCSDLAALEWALGRAFDAPDAPHISIASVASIPLDDWSTIIFQPHPASSLFFETWNAVELWLALKDGAAPAPARLHPAPEAYLIWRHDGPPCIRLMNAEETMLWQEAGRGANFGRLCELATHFDDPPGAAVRVAAHVRTWLDSGALTAVSSLSAG